LLASQYRTTALPHHQANVMKRLPACLLSVELCLRQMLVWVLRTREPAAWPTIRSDVYSLLCGTSCMPGMLSHDCCYPECSDLKLADLYMIRVALRQGPTQDGPRTTRAAASPRAARSVASPGAACRGACSSAARSAWRTRCCHRLGRCLSPPPPTPPSRCCRAQSG